MHAERTRTISATRTPAPGLEPKNFFANGGQPQNVFVDLGRLVLFNRRLIWAFSKKEITDRYAGHLFGAFWLFGHPLVLIGIYVFVFTVVLRLKIGGTSELPLNYTAYLLSGLIPWIGFQDAVARSCVTVKNHTYLVKNVSLPLEVLPVHTVIVSFLTQLIATGFLILYTATAHQTVLITYVLLPLLFTAQLLLMMGLGLLLSAVSVFFRDLKEVVQVGCLIGMYLVPIFYLPHWVPDLLRPVLYVNPFSHMIWCYQDVLYFGRIEHPWSWLVFMGTTIIALYIGYVVFRRLKTSFAGAL